MNERAESSVRSRLQFYPRKKDQLRMKLVIKSPSSIFLVVPILLLVVIACNVAPETESQRVARLQSEKVREEEQLDGKCYEINKKMNECELCTLTPEERSIGYRCLVKKMADERGLTSDELIEQNRKSQSKVPQTETKSAVYDGKSQASPRSKEDWDELIKQARKRDAEARDRMNQ
jgi:hypothetical protein